MMFVIMVSVAFALTTAGLSFALGYGKRSKQLLETGRTAPDSSQYKLELSQRRLYAIIASGCAVGGWLVAFMTIPTAMWWLWIPLYTMQIYSGLYMMHCDTNFKKATKKNRENLEK